MRSYDRPYFESQRERDRGYRERDASFARRRYGRRDDDDDRGPWISRDREPFEPELTARVPRRTAWHPSLPTNRGNR